ncbi:flavin monoamine oxidase family protein [Alkaliphilus serpentinus]|uniref:NAD(P)-binding protein n=1 Tax=Alkaliphilus serpentinus TaxID=1482731 RepID=A0A833MAU1_9FIRM|nr:FAD-dependent oxidoreductase [Alkaliphilus serpentinus]KAB3533219.1 NAD(P)-binding protein [Alkaliphilus serpentinus]
MITKPTMTNNPTPQERYKLLKTALIENRRPEDFDNIIELLGPPGEITTILPAGSCKNIKVAILGGGLAGLSAAFELRKLGFNITIFEGEEDRVGGRVYTHYFDKVKNLYGELGPMRIPVSHETTWHYIDLFGLKTRPFAQTNINTFHYVMDTRVRNRPEAVQKYIYPFFDMTREERSKEWPQLEAEGLEEYLLKMSPKIRREILEIKEVYSEEIVYADSLNVKEKLEVSGLSQGAISMLSSVNPFIGAFLYNSYFEILHEIYPLSFTYLYEIIGGMVNLPKSLLSSLLNDFPKEYSFISQGDIGKIFWRPGHGVVGIHQNERNHSIGISYKVSASGIEGTDYFDYVICALPFSNLRLINLNPLFSTKKMEAIRQINLSAAQKTILLCNYRFWEMGLPDERILGGGSTTDMVINTIWYPSNGREKNEGYINMGPFQSPACKWSFHKGYNPYQPGVITGSYNWTQDAVRLGNFPESHRIEIIKEQVEKVHGLPFNSLDSIVLDSKSLLWNNHPWSLGGVTFYMPQQKVDFSKVAIAAEYNNRLFFAGEHVSVSRSWMQGALQSGMLAANSIARFCKVYR